MSPNKRLTTPSDPDSLANSAIPVFRDALLAGRLAFSAAETCAILGVSDTSLWKLAKRGLLVPVKHLRHRIYSRKELERFLAQ